MVILTRVETEAVAVALDQLFTQGHFSICTVDRILAVTKHVPKKSEYDMLHLLHCTDYRTMSSFLRNEVTATVLRVIGFPDPAGTIAAQIVHEQPMKASFVRRLLGVDG